MLYGLMMVTMMRSGLRLINTVVTELSVLG